MQNFTNEESVNFYVETKHATYFGNLYGRYCFKVRRRCLLFISDEAQTTSQSQDIVLDLPPKINRFKQQSNFSTWLYAVTDNYYTDQVRLTTRPSLLSKRLTVRAITELLC